MEIGPLSNRRPGPNPGGGENHRNETPQSAKPRSRSTADRVEISFQARARLAEQADQELAKEKTEPQPIDSNELPSEDRLEQIRERIASGYYSSPDVRAKIVDRLIDDLDA